MKAKMVTACLGVFAALVWAPLLRAQDMVKVAPKNCRVVLDNDSLAAVDPRFPKPSVIVCIRGTHRRVRQ